MRKIIYILIFFLSCIASATDPATFWSAYLPCAVTDCLVPITNSYPCETNDNACVYQTSGFISQIASCLGKSCPNNVANTYNTYKSACAGSGFSLPINRTEFLATSGTLADWLQYNFWGGYPSCANAGCLSPLTAQSGCEIDDNACVCSNATLMGLMAGCIGNGCDGSEVGSVYDLYEGACKSNGGYSVALNSADWEKAAGVTSSASPTSTSVGSTTSNILSSQSSTSRTSTTSVQSSTRSSTSTTASTTSIPSTTTGGTSPTPSATASSGGGFTEDQKIALGVGIGVGLPPIFIGIITLCLKRKRGG